MRQDFKLFLKLIAASFALFLAIEIISCNKYKEVKEAVSVEYFKAGDVLLPDYACIDTLVVVDAVGLNKAIAPIEQGLQDAGDKDISDIMYKFCTIKK